MKLPVLFRVALATILILGLYGLCACQGYIGTEHAPALRLGGNANAAEQTQLDRDAGLLLVKDPQHPELPPAPVPPLPPQTPGSAFSDLVYIALALLGVGGTGAVVAGRRGLKSVRSELDNKPDYVRAGELALDAAASAVAEHDAAPFTPEDVASLEVAKAASAIKPVELKPVG